MIARILVPLDGSPLAEQAIAPAVAIARGLQARLLLVSAYQPAYAVAPVIAGAHKWSPPDITAADQRVEVETYLAGLTRQHGDVAIESAVHDGDPAGVIVDVAAETAADLIVMSTHGHTGVRRLIHGSVTERVLHAAACPVLVVRSPQPPGRILVPLDGSALGESILPPALEVARGLGARLVLLRVVELPAANPLDAAMSYEWDVQEPEQRRREELRHAADRYLHDVADRCELLPAEAQTIVLDGSPADRIQEFARLYDLDLIAMSTHGRTGLRRWLYGSVTHRVLRGAGRSMLIVRPEAVEKA